MTTANTTERPTVDSYKGHPTITLNPDARFPFRFGLTKARLILEHLESIRAFVATHADDNGND